MDRGRTGPGTAPIMLSIVLPLLLAAACGRTDDAGRDEFVPLVTFDTAAVRIETATDTFRLSVELAESDEQRSYGLMERSGLPEDHGMLFVASEPQDSAAGFWMYRTRVPLDIAFLDADGRIGAILAMQPCESPNSLVCRIYSPGVPYVNALEVGRGYFERRGIGVGARVVVLDEDGG